MLATCRQSNQQFSQHNSLINEQCDVQIAQTPLLCRRHYTSSSRPINIFPTMLNFIANRYTCEEPFNLLVLCCVHPLVVFIGQTFTHNSNNFYRQFYRSSGKLLPVSPTPRRCRLLCASGFYLALLLMRNKLPTLRLSYQFQFNFRPERCCRLKCDIEDV